MPIYSLGERHPRLADPVWIAANATVIGDVRLARNVSIWWNATLRGDNDPISIGENTNIQDGSVLHTDEGVPLTIGADVTVGHMVMLHGCTVGDTSLIGIGAVVLNRAVIGRECLIGAGSADSRRQGDPRPLAGHGHAGSGGSSDHRRGGGQVSRQRRALRGELAALHDAAQGNRADRLACGVRAAAVCGTWTNISPSLTMPSS